MPIASWVAKVAALGLVVAGLGCQRAAQAPVMKVSAAIENGQSVLKIEGMAPLRLERDATVAVESQVAEVKLIGQVGQAVVFVDSYESQPGPMSMCKAGEEKWVRVVALQPLAEKLQVKFASCRDNIEPESPGYSLRDGVLELRWLSGPDNQKAARYRVTADGSVTPQ